MISDAGRIFLMLWQNYLCFLTQDFFCKQKKKTKKNRGKKKKCFKVQVKISVSVVIS